MEMPFHLLVTKVFHAYRSKIRLELPALGLSPGQPKVLRMLMRHGGVLQKELAALCDIEPATVSRLLDNMEQQGLLKRVGVPGDKRAQRIEVTSRGKEVSECIEERFAALEGEVLADFSPQDREEFACHLAHLYRNLTGREID